MEACGLDDVCVAECEGVGQAGPGFKAPNASAASAPAADGSFSRIVGGRNAALLKEQAIRGPIITQAEQELLQTSQGVHGLLVVGSGFHFESRGGHKLKEVPNEWQTRE